MINYMLKKTIFNKQNLIIRKNNKITFTNNLKSQKENKMNSQLFSKLTTIKI